MEEGKKSFFASLEPKSALIVGMVGGVLVLCAVGFFILLFVVLNGKVNAQDTSAEVAEVNNTAQEQAPQQIVKSDKPIVELFAMSYCPYGLQMEKAYLPVMELLKNKADLSIKFVYYAMHGQKELEENTRQHCIQTQQPLKFLAYMNCFVGKDDYKACLASAKVDVKKMNACVSATDKQFGTMVKFKDQNTWLSGKYPLYPVNQDLNEKYGVQGSPSLVINGAEVQADRTPEGVKKVVCAAFNNPPAECEKTLSTTALQAGFGLGAGANTGSADCGN